MFTGIVTDLGRVRSVERRGDARFVIETSYDMDTVAFGASICCDGACLTVVEKGPGWFAVDVSAETLSRTTLDGWAAGRPVNLERSLKVGDELGGHIVSGHVDGLAEIADIAPDGHSIRFVFEVGPDIAPFVAEKGSVALNGVSLTVNEVEDMPGGGARFGVNLIPHTQAVTSFGAARAGDRVNLEVDMLARYTARLLARK